MPRTASPSETDQVCLYVEVRCRACFRPGLIMTWVNRPAGGQSPVANFMGRRLWRDLTFRCAGCDHLVADLVNVTEPKVQVVVPRRDPYPALPKAKVRRARVVEAVA